jgi:hypothetical protein
MTVKNYLLQLPADVSEKAIINTQIEVLDQPCDGICDALLMAFYWDKTPQGHDYWEGIYNAYESDTDAEKMFDPRLN